MTPLSHAAVLAAAVAGTLGLFSLALLVVRALATLAAHRADARSALRGTPLGSLAARNARADALALVWRCDRACALLVPVTAVALLASIILATLGD